MYAKALELSGLSTQSDRREAIAAKLFDELHVCVNQSHSLHKLRPRKCHLKYSLGNREHLSIRNVKQKDARIVSG